MVCLGRHVLQKLMKNPENIRNVFINSEADGKGKALIRRVYDEAGIVTTSDTRVEIEKSSLYPLFYRSNDKNQQTSASFLVNILEIQNGLGLFSRDTSPWYMCDGTVVLVDFAAGFTDTNEQTLRKLISHRIQFVIFIDSLDTNILQQTSAEEVYDDLKTIIEAINEILSIYHREHNVGQLSPENGNVIFGSLAEGWAFAIKEFSEIFARNFNLSSTASMPHLWGDNYFIPETNSWTKEQPDGINNAFIVYVLGHIYKVCNAVRNFKGDQRQSTLLTLGIEFEVDNFDMCETVMSKWFPLHKTFLEALVCHLPSPIVAQKSRMELLYGGSMDDKVGESTSQFNPAGPFLMSISKTISGNNSVTYGLGRIYSGVLKSGMAIKDHNSRPDIIHSVGFVTPDHIISIDDIPAGNICAFLCKENHDLTIGSISNRDSSATLRIQRHNYSCPPVVRISIQTIDPDHLPQLKDGLKLLQKTDKSLKITLEEYTCSEDKSIKQFIDGRDEIHLQAAIVELKQKYVHIPLKISELIPIYRETIIRSSSEKCKVKSPNKHNNAVMSATPLPKRITDDIETKKITSITDLETLATEFNYYIPDAKSIWSLGPNHSIPNILLFFGCEPDFSQYLEANKATIIKGLEYSFENGILAEEEVQGVQAEIHGFRVVANEGKTKPGQLIVTARHAFAAAFLTATPRLMEPFYEFEFWCPVSKEAALIDLVKHHRGYVHHSSPENLEETHFVLHVPVTKSFEFADTLRECIESGYGSCIGVHWEMIESDPLDPNSEAGLIVKQIRKFKSIWEDIVTIEKLNLVK